MVKRFYSFLSTLEFLHRKKLFLILRNFSIRIEFVLLQATCNDINMKTPLILFLLCFVFSGNAQSIKELEANLKKASSSKERMIIHLDLAEALLSKGGKDNFKKAGENARKAFDIAGDQKNYGMAAQSAYVLADSYKKRRDDSNTEIWLKTTLRFAKQAKDSDLIIKSVDERSKLAIKKRNYRKAYQVNQEAFDYFSSGDNSLSKLERTYDTQKVVLEKETKSMKNDKRDLEKEIARLERERDMLTRDKSDLTKKQEVLVQEKEQSDSLITQKEEALMDLSEAKEAAERRVKRREKEVQSLKRADLEKMVLLEAREKELAQAKLEKEKNQNLLKLAGLASIFLVLFAIVFYSRYRTKRSANNKLEEQNKIIEDERQRSDELLLNILPANIAEELKENGKAKAQKFNDASVLITDFKNFTAISERLTPEQLVKELDYCFRGFDFIISQYPNIEKIKTIGDAYMCASGLVGRKTLPNEIVKAALEMQEFLEDYKKDRSKKSLPFFEARIGIHTGPVVAGVVGVNKFAYDIWGDTVNIASRLESNCEEGKVNISAATYNEVKYKFECDYRGKVTAKNKGQIDMYYVRKAV